MNKKKFEAKVNEICAYEDEVVTKMRDFIKPYNEELNKQGCEIVCYPFWINNWNLNSDSGILLERPKIIHKQPYESVLGIEFKRIGVDLETGGVGYLIADNIVIYGITFFMGWSFSKYKKDWMFERVKNDFLLIKEKGIEEARRIILSKN